MSRFITLTNTIPGGMLSNKVAFRFRIEAMILKYKKNIHFIMLLGLWLLLATFAFQAHSGIAAAQLVTFDFTRPPLEPREDVDTAPWSRIVITELHRPTFDGAEFHVNDQLQAEAWAALYKSAQNQDDIVKIEAVNGFVNHLGLAVNASQNPEIPEWTAPREFFEGAKILDGAHALPNISRCWRWAYPKTGCVWW